MKIGGALAIGLIAGVVIGVLAGVFALPQMQSSRATDVLTPERAGNETVSFISNYLVLPGVDVELVNITAVEGESLYKVALNLSPRGESQIVKTYITYITITKDGKLLFPGEWIDINEFKKEAETRARAPQERKGTIGNFIVSGENICLEEGRPIVYFFGSNGCGHCKWEHPIIVNVTSKFEGYISLHDNMNNSTVDRDIFARYSPGGGVPTLVLGCKYYRIGSGEMLDKAEEAKVLTALICNLTANKPGDVCSNPEIEALLAQV